MPSKLFFDGRLVDLQRTWIVTADEEMGFIEVMRLPLDPTQATKVLIGEVRIEVPAEERERGFVSVSPWTPRYRGAAPATIYFGGDEGGYTHAIDVASSWKDEIATRPLVRVAADAA